MKAVLVAGLLGTGLGCRPAAPQKSPPATPWQAQVHATEVVGRSLDEHVPLLGGGALPLGSLRGFVVLLELGTTTQPGWSAAQARWRGLAEQYAARLRVVSVVIDSNPSAAGSVWYGNPPPFVLGWDPQGALAVRLGVTQLPTRFVLDSQGRVVAAISGAAPEQDEDVERAVRRTLAEES